MNRLATTDDVTKYGSYITPGDLIIDTKLSDGRIHHYFMGRDFPNIRENATIWIDGNMIGEATDIVFRNGGQLNAKWPIENATIRPIPGTQVRGRSLTCHGLKNVNILGTSEPFPGLTRWDRPFVTGRFGFFMKQSPNDGHNYAVNVTDGGSMRLEGVEAMNGFSGFRLQEGAFDCIANITVENFYCHDTGEGEAFYLGRTTSPPVPKLNCHIYNGILARIAAEAIQMQHLVGADVHNVTIFCADSRWLNEFQAFQDTCIQWVVARESNRIHHVLVDGFCSIALNPFGSAEGAGGISKVDSVLFNDGRDTGHYLHNSGQYGTVWAFENIFYRAFNNTYGITGKTVRPYIVSERMGKDTYSFDKIQFDKSKSKFFERSLTGIMSGQIDQVDSIPAPVYKNSGFYEPASMIMQWHQFYGSYFPISKNPDGTTKKVPTAWKSGMIAIDQNVGRFYKCITDHASDPAELQDPAFSNDPTKKIPAVRPGSSPHFVALTWDERGIRSDQPGWNTTQKQSNYPPDDFRLVEGNFYRDLGIGFLDREDVTGQPFIDTNGQLVFTTNKRNEYRFNPITITQRK